ncbi:hypothetical protein PVAND_015500 [Polypedilum vanderplanki]|uniref:Chitin-binding type-2 domain-containing protein n=1 Tax=Polypedilum vanderplanki TaxID=319348 RepID=A0A9J6BCC4_POLVA|nr:hypothetical protein PVAND_015500 [Polypedilum vanderplanki]
MLQAKNFLFFIFIVIFVTKSIQQNEICKGKDSSKFYSNSTDCTRFYRCVNGMKYDFQCGEDTIWYDEEQACGPHKNMPDHNLSLF